MVENQTDKFIAIIIITIFFNLFMRSVYVY